jgi:bifunctional DNA-binding transcriptional regulator/antitoxin component of YhaV-PrlF toxin-antitoxin module
MKKKSNRYLYHGTPKKNINILEPRVGVRMGDSLNETKQKGKSIHATTNKQIATGYMLNYDLWGTQLKKRWATTMHGYSEPKLPRRCKSTDPYVVVIGDRAKLKKVDKGGTLFKINKTKSFKSAIDRKDKIYGPYEYRSKRRIKPVDKIEYDSAVDAMIDNNMQVYIISKKNWKKYIKFMDKDSESWKTWRSPDRLSAKFIKTFTSENQKRKKNVVKWYP